MTAVLSVKDAAARLACSRQHVYDLIGAGKLRATDVGIGRPMTRIRVTDLEAFVAAATRTVEKVTA